MESTKCQKIQVLHISSKHKKGGQIIQIQQAGDKILSEGKMQAAEVLTATLGDFVFRESMGRKIGEGNIDKIILVLWLLDSSDVVNTEQKDIEL